MFLAAYTPSINIARMKASQQRGHSLGNKLPAMERLLSLCLTALSMLLVLWVVKLCGGKKKMKKRLPPGPWNLPIIGSLHHVVSVLPHRTITDLCRRYGPVMLLKLGEVPTVVVSSAEAIELVMRTHDLAFASRPRSVTMDIFGHGGEDIAFAPYGEHWRQMRKVCIVELLSCKQVRRLADIRAGEVGSLLDCITAAASTGATINISEKVMALSNHVVTRAVFGSKFTRQGEYLRELDIALRLMDGLSLVDIFPSSRLVRWVSNGERQMKRSYGNIQRMIANIIEERKAVRAAAGGDQGCKAGDEDLLDVLLRLQQEDDLEFPLTTETIGAVLFDIFAAGTETTGNVLAWAMSELVHNPEIMAKAQQEVREVLGEGRAVITGSDLAKLDYMRMVIKEVLRLHPPAPLVPRAAREDCRIMGYDISKGTNVYINVFAVSQDCKYWSEPRKFKPERFERNDINYNGTYFEFTPFGAGRRQCPGIQFSSSVMEVALTNFLYHFNWKLPDGVSLDMSEKFGLSVSKRHDLQLRAIPHVWSNAVSSK